MNGKKENHFLCHFIYLFMAVTGVWRTSLTAQLWLKNMDTGQSKQGEKKEGHYHTVDLSLG